MSSITFTPVITIALAQLNPTVGDVPGNFEKIAEAYLDADARGVDLVLTPALSLSGAPLEDLTDNQDFLDSVNTAFAAAGRMTKDHAAALVVGLPYRDSEERSGHAAVVLVGGKVVDVIGVSYSHCVVDVKGVKVGLFSGGDVWQGDADEIGADVIVRVAADVFRPGALEQRIRGMAALYAAKTGLPFISVNLVGGQDEVVFDGGSFVTGGNGWIALQLPQWEECVRDYRLGDIVRAGQGGAGAGAAEPVFPDENEEIWRAMVLGLRDYVRKSGFTDVVLGLSGGMDSAAVAAVAGDALGAEHVHCVRLPSRYTSDLSNRAAEEMCAAWGFSLETLPIMPVVEAATAATAPLFPEGLKKLSSENMQARIRGFLLMMISNDRNWLLLSTGNKSEIAVGYATLYGDMAGAYNPLKDLFKTQVYAAANWRNAHSPDGLFGPDGVVIPQEIIDRPPSAELSPDQLDTDSLPPYPVLDAILREFIEREATLAEAAARTGADPAVVLRVHRMLRTAEYKRRQAAPGPKLSRRALTLDRRMPIVNNFNPKEISLRATEI